MTLPKKRLLPSNIGFAEGNEDEIFSVSTSTIAGEKLFKGYFSTLASNWDYTKCKVIAFMYDADTYKVIQVVEKRIY